jgi:tetratricopeptide (TPR) repeat protein
VWCYGQGRQELVAQVAMRRNDPDAGVGQARLSGNEFLLATIHMMRDEPREALPLLQRIHDRGGPLPRGYYVLAGDVFLRLGRPQQARVAFERAVQVHPDDALARERLRMLSR